MKSRVAAELIAQDREAIAPIFRANSKVMNELVGFLANECCADSTAPSASQAQDDAI